MALVSLDIFKDVLFFEKHLPITDECPYDVFPVDKLTILTQLIDNIANITFLTIFDKLTDNIELGKRLTGLHPLNSLEFLFNDENTKKLIKIILSSNRLISTSSNTYAWFYRTIKEIFILSFCYYLKKRSEKSDIIDHLDSFCKKTNIEKTNILPMIEKEDWQSFLEKVFL